MNSVRATTQGCRLLVNDPRFAMVPKILEPPKGDDDEMNAVNLKTLMD